MQCSVWLNWKIIPTPSSALCIACDKASLGASLVVWEHLLLSGSISCCLGASLVVWEHLVLQGALCGEVLTAIRHWACHTPRYPG